jgi:hypothetical protein
LDTEGTKDTKGTKAGTEARLKIIDCWFEIGTKN